MDSETKTCVKCKTPKPIDQFTHGCYSCKPCKASYDRTYRAQHRESLAQWHREYAQSHRQEIYAKSNARRKAKRKPRTEQDREWARQWRANRTPEQKAERARKQRESNAHRQAKRKATQRAWVLKPGVRERLRLRQQAYKEQHRDHLNAHYRERRRTNASVRIAANVRSRIRASVLRQSCRKSQASFRLVGCSWSELRSHLERLWLPGMTWDNYNLRGWHIDHIRPCASFDLTDPDQQKQCFHWTNMQPLWAVDNIRKGKRLDWQPAL